MSETQTAIPASTIPIGANISPDDLFRSPDQSNNPYPRKIVPDYAKLANITKSLQEIGKRVVVTIGTWDTPHRGQLRYLLKASQAGDVLVVGVDTDRTIKSYKPDEWRPMQNQDERSELLSYLDFVDYITFIDDVEGKKWQYGLIQAIRPDIYVAVTDSCPPESVQNISQYCGRVLMLDRQAPGTSTTEFAKKITLSRVRRGMEEMLKSIEEGRL